MVKSIQMAQDKSNSRIAIIVAIITVLGSLIVAFINKWDFSSKPNPTKITNQVGTFKGKAPAMTVRFGGDDGQGHLYCDYDGIISELNVSISLDENSSTIEYVYTHYTLGDCKYPDKQVRSSFFNAKDISIDGDNINIQYSTDDTVRQEASFSGKITQQNIKGTATIKHHDPNLSVVFHPTWVIPVALGKQ